MKILEAKDLILIVFKSVLALCIGYIALYYGRTSNANYILFLNFLNIYRGGKYFSNIVSVRVVPNANYVMM
jgi:hypothetical protein